MNRARAVLAAAVLLWCTLLMAQWAAGPRDGSVAVSGRSDIGVGIGPTLGPRLFQRDASSGTRVALLLLLAPAGLAAAGWFAARSGVDRRTILLCAAALGLATFLELPGLSNDVFLYRAAGEMLAAGANPYLQAPADHFGAEQLRGVPWATQKSPYGPLALAAFAAAWLSTGSWPGSLWLLRALMALPWVLALAVFARARVAAALVFLATSPLLLLEVVQGGHLDGWIGLLLVVLCLTLARNSPRRRDRLALVLAFAAVLAIKVAVVVVAGAVFVHLGRHPRWGPLRAALAGAAVLALAVLAWMPLWSGAATLDGVRAESTKVLQSLYQVLRVPRGAAGALATAGSLAALLAGVTAARRGWSPAASCILALALQAVIGRTFLQSWYFVPVVMLVALVLGSSRAAPGLERALGDPLVWSVASVGLLFGGYGVVFATRSISAPVQTANVALMILPGLLALLRAARLEAHESQAPGLH